MKIGVFNDISGNSPICGHHKYKCVIVLSAQCLFIAMTGQDSQDSIQAHSIGD